MTLELVMRGFAPNTRNDRISQDIRAYVRAEWQGDASWLRREVSPPSLRTRFRAWRDARRSVARTPPISAGVVQSTDEESAIPAPVDLADPCLHLETEELGLSGGAVFLRCVVCGDVFVTDRGHKWSLGLASPTAPVEGVRL